MHRPNTAQILVFIFFFLLFCIPTTTFLLAQRYRVQSPPTNTTQQTITQNKFKAKSSLETSALEELKDNSQTAAKDQSSESSETESSAQILSGPTLGFKVRLEGRPLNNQTTKLFLGIAEGEAKSNPAYILSFSIDLPATGIFSGLSLAGLNTGSTYTAYLKGQAQIATASAFILKPKNNELNSGNLLNLLSGDLNEDNVINDADLTVARRSIGPAKSDTFNPNADLNLDGVVNNFDLNIISRNLGKAGISGSWYSRPPQATSSGGLTPFSGTPEEIISPDGIPEQTSIEQSGGYWIWVPKL